MKLSRWEYGMETIYQMDQSFFTSQSHVEMMELGHYFNDIFADGGTIKRGEKKLEVTEFSEVVDWLDKESRKGLVIQRYKGLGEMNPEQLWETTMNPETRTMMQVTIEDAIAADEVFTTLMGDQVEPRRDFIEENALSVANLDI